MKIFLILITIISINNYLEQKNIEKAEYFIKNNNLKKSYFLNILNIYYF